MNRPIYTRIERKNGPALPDFLPRALPRILLITPLVSPTLLKSLMFLKPMTLLPFQTSRLLKILACVLMAEAPNSLKAETLITEENYQPIFLADFSERCILLAPQE